MASIQEEGYEERLSELAPSEGEWQAPAKRRLQKLLIHSNLPLDVLDSIILHVLITENSKGKAIEWPKIVPKLRKRKKKRSKRVHGRLTYLAAQPPSRMWTCSERSITSCPGRRCSRPVGSCWAGKGACLQDFYSIAFSKMY